MKNSRIPLRRILDSWEYERHDLFSSTLYARSIETFGEAAFREEVLFQRSKLLVEKIAAQVQKGQGAVRDQLGG
jgi:hypothetical protein